jgi:hypothetical protein
MYSKNTFIETNLIFFNWKVFFVDNFQNSKKKHGKVWNEKSYFIIIVDCMYVFLISKL